MNRIAALLATALITFAASAQDIAEEQLVEEEPLRRYSVEVIVFTYLEDVAVGSEIFLPDDPPPEPDVMLDEDGNPIFPEEDLVPVFADDIVQDDAAADEEDPEEELPPTWVVATDIDAEIVDLPPDTDAEEPNPFQLVLMAEDEFALGDAIYKFELLDAYETLLHFGWTQPAFPEEETPAIDLQLLAEPPEGLNGTLTLYLSRYLHLVVDLALDAPGEFEEEVIDDDSFFSFDDARRQYGDESDAMPIRFRIQENRIFKNGDLRYFDHPRFGVLALISRVEEAEDEDTETDDSGEALADSSR